MAEDAPGGVKDIDILDKLEKWAKETRGFKDPAIRKKCHEEFFSISQMLSEILPRLHDRDLFEIEGILYPNQKWADYETSRSEFNAEEIFERIDMTKYFMSYYVEVLEFKANNNILYDYTLLKVLKHQTENPGNLGFISIMLLDSGNERVVCFGLRFLKAVFEAKLGKYMQCREVCSLVSNYRDIPIPEDPTKKKIASYIAKLAKECYGQFDEEFKEPDLSCVASKRKIRNSIQSIYYSCDSGMPIFYRNILYDVFTSAKDEEKHSYLECFVRAIPTSCRRTLFDGFIFFTTCLLESIINSGSHSRDNILRLIDRKCGRNIEAYLPGVDVPIEPKRLWNDENNEDGTDYTFEKFFFYDEVVKNLHLLKMFYAAAAECNKTICKDELDEEDYTKAFRDDELLMSHIGFYLVNKDSHVPWFIQKTLEMCPFVIFPIKQNEQVFDLIRVLRREEFAQSEELSNKIKQLEDCCNKRWKEGYPIKFEPLPPILK